MSANITIYYGFRFNANDIKNIFQKEIPKDLESIEETEFDFENCYFSYFFPVKNYFTLTDNIKYAVCDFENDEGEEMLVIGNIVSKSFSCNYSGICEVPEIDEKTKKSIEKFLELNPKLKNLQPKFYVYLDQNK